MILIIFTYYLYKIYLQFQNKTFFKMITKIQFNNYYNKENLINILRNILGLS